MTKKFDDYYDHENKVQLNPQTWECTICNFQVQVLSAEEIGHKCPSNKSLMTPFKKVEKVKPVKKTRNIKKIPEINKVKKEENETIK